MGKREDLIRSCEAQYQTIVDKMNVRMPPDAFIGASAILNVTMNERQALALEGIEDSLRSMMGLVIRIEDEAHSARLATKKTAKAVADLLNKYWNR